MGFTRNQIPQYLTTWNIPALNFPSKNKAIAILAINSPTGKIRLWNASNTETLRKLPVNFELIQHIKLVVCTHLYSYFRFRGEGGMLCTSSVFVLWTLTLTLVNLNPKYIISFLPNEYISSCKSLACCNNINLGRGISRSPPLNWMIRWYHPNTPRHPYSELFCSTRYMRTYSELAAVDPCVPLEWAEERPKVLWRKS